MGKIDLSSSFVRGRLVYVLLGLLVIALYVKTGLHRPADADGVRTRAMEEVPPWWPSDLDEARLKTAIAKSPALGAALSLLTMVLFGMGGGGIALLIWGAGTGRLRGLWRFASGWKPQWSFGELARVTLLLLLVAALLPFLALVVPPPPAAAWDHRAWMTLSMLALDVFAILLVLAFARAKGGSAGRVLGLSGARSVPSIAAGLRGYVAVFPWLFLVLFAVVELARSLHLRVPVEPIQELLFEERRPAVLGLIVALACVVGPVAEELFFRGVVYSALRRRIPRPAAMLLSAAAFSLAHTNLLGFLPITMLGGLLAYLYERTGSLAGPLAVHILHNTLLMSLTLVFRQLVLVP
ncbi:MAG: CPBP family intramembrane metalloprotease [Candidatus Omnitrophica bacterium]|nr:CPBP family intramembrane metalloprotease [Candidatus Omnitrophota bacterium]